MYQVARIATSPESSSVQCVWEKKGKDLYLDAGS